MRTRCVEVILVSVGFVWGITPLAVAGTHSSGTDQKSQQERELGSPAPQTANDTEDTHKKRDPNTSQTPDSNRQITVGGAQSTIEGEIVTVNGQNFDIKTAKSGDQVRVVVNQDTNLDCGNASHGGRDHQSQSLASDRIANDQDGAKNDRQKAQGQRPDETARGSGFRIGSCDFHQGDRVKAEVDDLGRVTTLKYIASASQH